MYRSRLACVLAMAGLAALLVPSSLTAQITFQRTYGGADDDIGYSVQQTDDGGYILAGATRSFGAGNADAYLIKVDALGDTLWTRTLGGENDDYGGSVRQTADGGYIVAGGTQSFGAGNSDLWLIKTDASGDTLWTRTFGGAGWDGGGSIEQTADGGYIVAGVTNSFGAGSDDVWLVKTDSFGQSMWAKTFGGTSDDGGSSVHQNPDGGYIVAGVTNSFGAGSDDAWLIMTDSLGDTLWTRTYGDTFSDEGSSVQPTADRGYVLAGSTTSFGAGSYDVYLIKTDANGDTLWTRTFGGTVWDDGYSVQQTSDGGYVIAGMTRSFGAGNHDACLIKTDADGNAVWTRAFGGDSSDYGFSLQQTTDRGYIMVGYTESFGAGGQDVYLIKTDSLGDFAVSVAEPKASPTPTAAMSLTCEPNPFSGATTIRLSPFAIGHSPLTLRIYDAQGRAVRSFSSLLSAPSSLTWDGADDLGQPLPSGAYFVRVNGGNEHATTRIVLQR